MFGMDQTQFDSNSIKFYAIHDRVQKTKTDDDDMRQNIELIENNATIISFTVN